MSSKADDDEGPSMSGRWFAVMTMAASLLVGGAVGPQGTFPVSSVPVAAAAEAPTGTEDRTILDQQLATARAEYSLAESEREAPPGASPDEALERRHLLSELTLALERRIDILGRLPEARQRQVDQETRTRAWRPGGEIKPVSILIIDRQREILEDTRARLKTTRMRQGYIEQRTADDERRLPATDVAVRQLSEKMADTLPEEQKRRQAWLLELARLRERAAFASLADARSAKELGDAELAELLALEELQQKQLTETRGAVVFPQSDLDTILARLDGQILAFKESEIRLQQASAHSHTLLQQARTELTAAKDGRNGDHISEARLKELERKVALSRIRVDTDDLAYEILRRTVEAKGWERAGWQYRWYLYNGGDRAKARDAVAELDGLIEHLEGASRYLQAEIARLGQLGDGSADDGDAELRAAYLRRAQILRDAQSVADSVLATFRIWAAGLQAEDGGRSWEEVVRGEAVRGADALRAAWNLELFTAEDTVVIDGRRVEVSRSITIGKTLGVILLVLVGALLSRQAMNLFCYVGCRYFRMQKAHAATLGRWSHILVVAVLFFIALYIADIPLTVFAFLGGALAIGVGFGAQVLLKNMISGVMLLIERPLRVGDLVEVGAVTGTVTQINVRSSTVLTSDGIEILVPNSTFIENNVTNWTYSNAQVRRSVSVGTSYASPPVKVEQVLMRVAESHPAILQDPAPSVLLDGFGPDAIHFTLRYWIEYTDGADGSKIASEIRFKIVESLAEAGIEIPGPQRVVRIKKE